MPLLSGWRLGIAHWTICRVLLDLAELLRLATKSRSALVAENLSLRKRLALFEERNIKALRAPDSARPRSHHACHHHRAD
jgi:hypothetical protein